MIYAFILGLSKIRRKRRIQKMKHEIKKTIPALCAALMFALSGCSNNNEKQQTSYQISCGWPNNWGDYDFVLDEDQDTVLKVSISSNLNEEWLKAAGYPEEDWQGVYDSTAEYKSEIYNEIKEYGADWYQAELSTDEATHTVNYTVTYDFTADDFDYEENREFFADPTIDLARYYDEVNRLFSFSIFKAQFDTVEQINCSDLSQIK